VALAIRRALYGPAAQPATRSGAQISAVRTALPCPRSRTPRFDLLEGVAVRQDRAVGVAVVRTLEELEPAPKRPSLVAAHADHAPVQMDQPRGVEGDRLVDGDWDQAMGPDGALEALIDAREEGLARFIGVTGHGWTIAAMHRRSLSRFDFDAVLLPYNFFMAQQERYRRDFEEVLGLCRERNVAVQVIKSIARGLWATGTRTHTTWYQPLEAQAHIDRAVHWVLGLPDVFVRPARWDRPDWESEPARTAGPQRGRRQGRRPTVPAILGRARRGSPGLPGAWRSGDRQRA
jgi:hypothetical protein